MTLVRWVCSAVLVSLLAVPAAAQDANPLTASTKGTYESVKTYIVKSAEKMPEEQYGFQPTPEVRTFGQLLGHIANANYMICARAADEKSPSTENIEKTKTTKADLIAALNAAFAYCDGVWAKTTDASGMEVVDFFNRKQPRIAVLSFNTAHDYEHYGNLVTYLRIKGIVPPSSEGRGM